jgi:hypothetical protein
MPCSAFGEALSCHGISDRHDELEWSHLRAFDGRLSFKEHLKQTKGADSAGLKRNELVAIDASR